MFRLKNKSNKKQPQVTNGITLYRDRLDLSCNLARFEVFVLPAHDDNAVPRKQFPSRLFQREGAILFHDYQVVSKQKGRAGFFGPPGEEPKRPAQLVKKLSDRRNSRCSLVAYLSLRSLAVCLCKGGCPVGAGGCC